MYLRFVIGGYLKANAEEYEPFLMEYSSINQFVEKEVLIIDREADFLQIIALLS